MVSKEKTKEIIDKRVRMLQHKAKKRREKDLWYHPTHKMSEWYSDVRSPCGTPRFYSVRECELCGWEQSEHPAGRFCDYELKNICPRSDIGEILEHISEVCIKYITTA